MRKIVIVAMVALLALAITTVTVFGHTLPFGRSDGPQQQGNARTLNQENDKPYIGIVVSTLEKAKAQELGIPGGAVVSLVVADSPSAGVLKAGDIILSINSHQVTDAQTVVKIVQGSKVGDALNMDVRRGDATIKVEVKVGSRPIPERPPKPSTKGITGIEPLLRLIPGLLSQHVLNAQIVVQTDQGPKTIKVLAGSVASVDTAAKSIIVSPKDGSANVPFGLTSGTTILIKRSQGDLSGVKTGDEVRVVSVDSEVKLVLVGPLQAAPQMAPFQFQFRGHGRFGAPGRMGPRTNTERGKTASIAIPEPEQNTNGWLTS